MRLIRLFVAFVAVLLSSCNPAQAQSSTYPSAEVWGTAYSSGFSIANASTLAAMVTEAAAAYGGAYTFLTCTDPANANYTNIYASVNSCAVPSWTVYIVSATCTGSDTLSSDKTTCTAVSGSGGSSGTDAASLALIGVDAATITMVYSWGVGVVLTLWALGFATGVAVKVIAAL